MADPRRIRLPTSWARTALVITTAGAVALAVACSGSEAAERPTTSTPSSTTPGAGTPTADRGAVYPGAEWATTTAEAAGLDRTALDRVAESARTGGSNCLVVVRDGKLVDEHYWNGTGPDSAQEVWSATKSFTSTLVGMAQADGRLQISDPAWKTIPAWKGTPSGTVTIRNLLSNDSGRHYDARTDYVDMATNAKDKTAFAVGLGQDAPPGTEWRYNNSAIQTLSAVLAAATGEQAATYAADRLFDPLGMTHSKMTSDPAGNTLMFMGLRSTCRDMARYGHLMLREGTWNGRSIVPASWVREATRPSQDLNGNYGYLWWLNRPGDRSAVAQASGGDPVAAMAGATEAPKAPEDMFFAIGLGNQIIAVDPGSGTVVVRLGPTRAPAGATTFGPTEAAAVAATAVRDR